MTKNTSYEPVQRLVEERREKLQWIKDNQQKFAHQFERTHLAKELQQQYESATREFLEENEIECISICGRIMAKRGPFIEIQDRSGRIQIYADKPCQQSIKEQWGQWDTGDIVGISGRLQRSGKGDLYVQIKVHEMLNKSLRSLPEKHAGLVDTELRYRQRYLDLIVNQSVRAVFTQRTRIIDFIRQFFNQRDYVEVETPMLHPIPGGATAKPFATFHNALQMPVFLRIAPELYLKRLVVGGMERVYEINRNFRNEGLSTRHNPEFTMLEFYQAYSNYTDLMILTEELLGQLCQHIHGCREFEYQGQNIDFNKPFKRISVVDSVLYYNPTIDKQQLHKKECLLSILEGLHCHTQPHWGIGKMQIEIFEKTVEHQLIEPTFIIDYPAEVSPLSRCKPEDDSIAERFELFVGGREIANGFSELNDSALQAQRFQQQVAQKQEGEEEAMYFDEDYIKALEYAMPPTAGEGIGIDRLVMLLTNSASIRDVLLFPAMKQENSLQTKDLTSYKD